MKSFKIVYQLQRAALMHMAKTSIPLKEKNHLKAMFDALDDDCDGALTIKEITDGMAHHKIILSTAEWD